LKFGGSFHRCEGYILHFENFAKIQYGRHGGHLGF
jgi:hypothetical protein